MLDTNDRIPQSNYDPYHDGALPNPFPGYDMLRDMGPAVWLTKYEMYALTRYSSVKQALNDDTNFVSGRGVMMNEQLNKLLVGNTLCSDGEMHTRLRKVTAAPMTPGALKSLQDEIRMESEGLVDRLLGDRGGRFDAVKDLAQYLPLKIVSNAVGLAEEGRERMLEWSEAAFNCFGPENERMLRSLPVLGEMVEYANNQAVRGKLRKGSWADAILDAADSGAVPKEAVSVLMGDYLVPSLDTTISGIVSAVWHFARSPDQWDKLRNDNALLRNAVNEVLRLEAPLQGFGRYVANDVQMDGVTIPKDSRVICFYGAANRDPRQFENPDRFDIARNNANMHLSFGFGTHQCLGMNLARLEIVSLFTALLSRVRRFHVRNEKRLVHNLVRNYEVLEVEVEFD